MSGWRRVGHGWPWPQFSAGAGALALLGLVAAAAAPGAAAHARAGGGQEAGAVSAVAGDTPAGFWYGTDSWPMPVTGRAPYQEPVIGSPYGGYMGMAGNWAAWQGCGDKVAWAATNSTQANNDFTWHHVGIGTGVYWFMAGPGLDPRYNGTASQAHVWGARQAAATLAAMATLHVKYPVVFADVELPGNAPGISPAPDNGWNSVYSSPCSGRVTTSYIAPAVDRADLDGFYAYLTAHSSYKPGVYSSPAVWADIFGTGSASMLTGTYEWTYTGDSSSLVHVPSGWCLQGTAVCAQFFGGVTRSSTDAVMWQWSGGGGTYNGYGDFDQIDANRTP
jgi:hypothetical protein